jgi:hypothetical protein
MRSRLTFVLLGTIAMCGCLSTVRLNRDPLSLTDKNKRNTKVLGVPFYVKVAKCKQETSWLQPVYTLTLKKTSIFSLRDESTVKAHDANSRPTDSVVRFNVTKVLSLSQINSNDVQNLKTLLSQPRAADLLQARVIDDAWKNISGIPDYQPLAANEDALVGSGDVFELSNASNAETVVDYSRLYYYNAPRPLIGTSQIDATFASDGTLTEASAQVQGQTLSTILSTILSVVSPSALLTNASNVGTFAAAALPPDAVQETFQYELTTVETGYIHTHARYVDFALPCPLDKGGVRKDFSLLIQSLRQAMDKKNDGNTVKVKGTIDIPREEP